jgi:hypothetical protein
VNKWGFIAFLVLSLCGACKRETNVFTFCRDFTPEGCIEPLSDKVFFDLNKTIQNKSLREFYNSLYFRGDRLAFAIKNADARKAVSFECLHGRYTLGELTTERHELEYIELQREKRLWPHNARQPGRKAGRPQAPGQQKYSAAARRFR